MGTIRKIDLNRRKLQFSSSKLMHVKLDITVYYMKIVKTNKTN